MTKRVRMVAVLGLLVGINALFVLTVLWGVLVLLPTVVTAVLFGGLSTLADLARLPVAPVTYTALLAVFLAGQLYYGYRRVLSGTRVGDGSDTEVAEVVRRLSMGADVPTPDTTIVEDETPSCYTVGRVTDATIVVTTGLISELDGDELEAVLAHEVAHIANRDVTLMTITTLMLEIATRAYHAVRLVPRAIADMDSLSGKEQLALRWALPLSVGLYLLVSPLLLVFPKLADWATRTLSHAREFAADEAAARMTGEPLALATALVSLNETTDRPERDLRGAQTQALCIVPTRLVTGHTTTDPPSPGDSSTDRSRTVSNWLDGQTGQSPVSGTHPPVDERVSRLQELAGQQEWSR
jgi:heat shock protein HtpX